MSYLDVYELADRIKEEGLPVLKVYEEELATDAGIEITETVSVQVTCEAFSIDIWDEDAEEMTSIYPVLTVEGLVEKLRTMI